MSVAISTKKMHEFLLNGFSVEKNETIPIERDGDTAFVKFDEIEIKAANDGSPGVLVNFLWHGEALVFNRVEGYDLPKDQTLNICGIEGRQKIRLV